MSVVFRNAGFADIKKVLKLHNKFFNYPSFYFWFFLSFFPQGELLLCTSGEKIVGYVMSFNNRITELCVDSNFSGKGIGKKLINKSKSSNFNFTVVLTANNHGALAFYEKLGFEIKSSKNSIFRLEKQNNA